MGRTKVYINGPGHMTKKVATPIYGKNLKNLLQKLEFYDFETLQAASSSTQFV